MDQQESQHLDGQHTKIDPARLGHKGPGTRRLRWRFWVTCMALLMAVPLGLSLNALRSRQPSEEPRQLAAMRAMKVEQVASVTIYNHSGRLKKLLGLVDDPALFPPFVEAMNQLEDYSPNHPSYSVMWYAVLQLDNGRRIGLKFHLMHAPDTTVYVTVMSAKSSRLGWDRYLARAKSPILYDWLVEHACREADAATIDVLDGGYHSGVHRAVMGGHTEILQLLLDRGADINRRNRYGFHTPLDLAVTLGDKEMINFLRQRGAKRDFELRR